MFDVDHFFSSIQGLVPKYSEEKLGMPKLADATIKSGDKVKAAIASCTKSAEEYGKTAEIRRTSPSMRFTSGSKSLLVG